MDIFKWRHHTRTRSKDVSSSAASGAVDSDIKKASSGADVYSPKKPSGLGSSSTDLRSLVLARNNTDTAAEQQNLANKFEYDFLLKSDAVQQDSLKVLCDFPTSGVELATIPRRRLPLPTRASSNSSLKSHVRESLLFFTTDWTVLKRRVEIQTQNSPRPIGPAAQHTFPSQFPGNPIDGDTPDAADVSLLKRYDRLTTDKHNAQLRTAHRDDLAALWSVGKTESGSQPLPGLNTNLLLHHSTTSSSVTLPGAWPEHTRGSSVRMIEVAVRELRFVLGDIEPFFCELSVFDVVRKVRISDAFHFEVMNNENGKEGRVTSAISKALFFVSYPSPDIFLILRIERLFQRDKDDQIVELYQTPEKAKTHMKVIAASQRAPNHIREPFAYGFLSLFGEASDRPLAFVGENMINLLRPPKGDFSDANICSSITEVSKGGSLKKTGLRQIPGQLAVNCAEVYSLPSKRVDLNGRRIERTSSTGVERVVPDTAPLSDDACQELYEFNPLPPATPHMSYLNQLYLYVESVNFSTRSSSSAAARNILIKVQLLETEGGEPLPAFISGTTVRTEAFCSVTYRSKSPVFYDEIRVMLPTALSGSLHFLFTFYHLKFTQKSTSTTGPSSLAAGTASVQIQIVREVPVGYAFIPVYRGNTVIGRDPVSLPVLYELPQKYLNVPQDDSSLKWVDNRKSLFRLRCVLVSTIYSQEEAVSRLLNYFDEGAKGLKLLRGVNGPTMLPFLPIVLAHLLRYVLNGSTQVEAFEALMNLLWTMQADASATAAVACNYAEHVYKPEIVASQRPMHEELSKLWLSLLKSPEESSSERLVKFNGFFLRLIMKSMVLQSIGNGQSSLGTSASTFSSEFLGTLRQLIEVLANEVQLHSKLALNLAKELNRQMAAFIRDAFYAMDRGTACLMMEKYVASLSSASAVVADLKVQFLRTVVAFEHFIQISIPVPRPLSTSLPMLQCWQRYHQPIYVLITQLIQQLSHSERLVRQRALQALIEAFNAHDLSVQSIVPSSEQSAAQRRVCWMYLPVVPMVMDLLPLIRSSYSHDEKRRLCHFLLCILKPLAFGQSSAENAISATTLRSSSRPVLGVSRDSSGSPNTASRDSLVGTTPPSSTARSLASSHPLDSLDRWWYSETRKGHLQFFELLQLILDVLEVKPTTTVAAASSPAVASPPASPVVRPLGIPQSTSRGELVDSVSSSTTSLVNSPVVTPASIDVASQAEKHSEAKEKLESYFASRQAAQPTPTSRAQMRQNLTQIRQQKKAASTTPESTSPRASSPISDRRIDSVNMGSASNSGFGSFLATGDNASPSGSLIRHSAISLESALSAEASYIVLDVCELFIAAFLTEFKSLNPSLGDPLLESLITILTSMLSKISQPVDFVVCEYASLRALAVKLARPLFLSHHNYLAPLVLPALRHCKSHSSTIRSEAISFLYTLMRLNFTVLKKDFKRMKVQVTTALSQVVSQGMSEEEVAATKKALRSLPAYATLDSSSEPQFSNQVNELSSSLLVVLRESVSLQLAADDVEGTSDQLVRIMEGHRHAPELQLAWLNNIAAFHLGRSNNAAAAEAFVHIAALVANVVHSDLLLDWDTLSLLSPNLSPGRSLTESSTKGAPVEIRGSDYADFTLDGFLKALDSARKYFCDAQLFHAANNVCKVSIPVLEKLCDYDSLISIHSQLQSLFQNLISLNRSQVKYSGSYYRVGFYGKAFGPSLDSCEFIYHEPQLTKLGHFKDRLTRIYEKQLGKPLEFFFDSKPVDRSKLNPDSAYLQITAVEPYRVQTPSSGNAAPNSNSNSDNYLHTKRFFFETPFTTGGNTSQANSIADQYKRKTILSTQFAMPYLSSRVRVTDREELTLSPIENAMEMLQNRTSALQREVQLNPPSVKALQAVLQGSVRLQVHLGPQEICKVFLSSDVANQYDANLLRRMRVVFKHFIEACAGALELNKSLIGPEQTRFHEELEQGYKDLRTLLAAHGVEVPEVAVADTDADVPNESENSNTVRFAN